MRPEVETKTVVGGNGRNESSKTARELLFGDLWEYAPAPERSDHVRKSIAAAQRHFIDGVFVEGEDHFPTINPATEEVLSQVPSAGAPVIDAAVDAARRAFTSWSALRGGERAKILYRVGRIIQERARELAILESLDNGKPIKESRDVDLPLAAAHFLYYAGWADKLEYAFPSARTSPIGVVGQVIPWNFPLLMAAWKIAPALATGNTVVLKPAETTPLTAAKLCEILEEASVPKGVVNVIHGGGDTGALLVSHPGIDKVAFTGSTEVGKKIQRALAGTKKRLTLELGGKGANVVFEDAPIDQAIEGIVNGIFFNQGQVCCAGSRLLVQESVADVVVSKLRDRMKTLRVGDPLDKNTDVGAINSRSQLDRIHGYIESGQEEGAELYAAPCELPSRGYFVAPSMFTRVSQSHRIAREEIFGPVVAVQTFRTPKEVIEKANNSPYGLSAGIWSDKGSKLFQIAGAMRSGVVWGNTFNRFDPGSPFGGYKESGFGREGGRQGLLAYMEVR